MSEEKLNYLEDEEQLFDIEKSKFFILFGETPETVILRQLLLKRQLKIPINKVYQGADLTPQQIDHLMAKFFRIGIVSLRREKEYSYFKLSDSPLAQALIDSFEANLKIDYQKLLPHKELPIEKSEKEKQK